MNISIERVLTITLVLIILGIPIIMGLGKYQICKYYFSEMNSVACFFTQLPAVNTGHKK